MEIRQLGRGHIVVVTDGMGKVIRYPIRLSKFEQQAKFYQKEKQQIEAMSITHFWSFKSVVKCTIGS